MKLILITLVAVVVGMMVGCSSTNIEATVEARLAQERGIEATVEARMKIKYEFNKLLGWEGDEPTPEELAEMDDDSKPPVKVIYLVEFILN